MIEGMKTPIFIRPLTEDEQHQIQAGLRSSDAFVLRRCQILTGIRAWGTSPSYCAPIRLRRPNRAQCDPRLQCDGARRCCKKALRVPIDCARPSRRTELERLQRPAASQPARLWPGAQRAGPWTWLPRSASSKASSPAPVSDESVRRALKRLENSWKRAKHWITSPDPQYLLKKTLVTA